jgi:hypothetical protein
VAPAGWCRVMAVALSYQRGAVEGAVAVIIGGSSSSEEGGLAVGNDKVRRWGRLPRSWVGGIGGGGGVAGGNDRL